MTKQPDPKFIVWTDTETTGLDKKHDYILEYAHVITDMQLIPVEPLWQTVVQPPDPKWLGRLEANEFVNMMHVTNGLKRAVLAGQGMSYRALEREVCVTLARLGEPQDFIMGGTGVQGFDLPLFEKQLPSIHHWYRYFTMDIGPIRRFTRHVLLNGFREHLLPPEADENHRAASDVTNALSQAMHFARMLGAGIPPMELL